MNGIETNHDKLGLLDADTQDNPKKIYGPNSIADHGVCELDQRKKEQLRNHIGFWILGLANNFAYVVMLSAAFDILGNRVESGGKYELLYYENSIMDQSQQYRWFQFCYELGVFLSRSSVYCFKIEKIELLTAFQYINFIVLLLEVYYRFIPNVWITFGISLFEGLLGGAVYVNVFHRLSTGVQSRYREFSMGATSMANSTGIALAGVLAMQLYKSLCTNSKPPT
eukprot:gene13522-14934_t